LRIHNEFIKEFKDLVTYIIISFQTKMNTTTPLYAVSIYNRAYTSWEFHYADLHNEIVSVPGVSPAAHKLFSGDVFSMDTGVPVIVSSTIRTERLSGVLILDTGRTYGRLGRRLLYKCIPDDQSLPAFVIPYEIKASFSKATKNKFIVFRFMEWGAGHPVGEIVDTLGDVDDMNAFYEYQIWRNRLHININDFTKTAGRAIHAAGGEAAIIESILLNHNFVIEDHRHIDNVFSIDPSTSTDYDDAFSVIYEDNCIIRVNVYIANVFVWLEALGLWSSFTGRVSTIYLPDKKRPMLPGLLSDGACSLKEGYDRFAFMMTVAFDEYGNVVEEPSFKTVVIRVNKNYAYEEPALKKTLSYRNLYRLTKLLDSNTVDSHDVVAFWMIYMNHWAAVKLSGYGVGVFRGTTGESATSSPSQSAISSPSQSATSSPFSDDVMRVIKAWSKDSAGSYSSYCGDVRSHAELNLSAYTHITSPIRRIVDLVNQMLFFKSAGFVKQFSEGSAAFLDKWTGSLNLINKNVKLIRRTQMDCELLQRCKDIDVVGKQFCGVIIDYCEVDYGFYEYTVYLEELKLLAKVRSADLMGVHSVATFSMFMFDDEDKLYKKVRLQMV
jgi:exoribonuclease R